MQRTLESSLHFIHLTFLLVSLRIAQWAKISRFTNGNETVRDKKVHMMVQIGQSQTLSFLGILLVRFLAFLVSLTQKGRESPMSLEARRDRIPLPAIRVASYGETFHFGGALQTDKSLPQNYHK